MRKSLLKQLGIALLVSFAPSVWAGTDLSGGGTSVVCRDSSGNIKSAELLDLFEAKIRFGLTVSKSDDNPRDQIARAISWLNQGDAFASASLKESVAEIVSKFQFLPAGIGIRVGEDLGSDYAVLVPDGCALENVGYYEADGSLKVAPGIYSAFSMTDRAAFVLHEAVYRLARETSGFRDSALSRRLVGQLFASGGNPADRISLATALIYANSPYSDPAKVTTLVLDPNQVGNIDIKISPESDKSIFSRVVCQDYRGFNNGLNEWAMSESTGSVTLSPRPAWRCEQLGVDVTEGRRLGAHHVAFSYSLSVGGRVVSEGRVSADAEIVDWMQKRFFFAVSAPIPEIPSP